MQPIPLGDHAELASFRFDLIRALFWLWNQEQLLRQFHAAFQKRSELPWLPEHTSDRKKAIGESIAGALVYLPLRSESSAAPPDLPELVVSAEFWEKAFAAVSEFDDRRLHHLSYDLCTAKVDRKDPDALCAGMALALKTYAERTARGEGLSSDPW